VRLLLEVEGAQRLPFSIVRVAEVPYDLVSHLHLRWKVLQAARTHVHTRHLQGPHVPGQLLATASRHSSQAAILRRGGGAGDPCYFSGACC
jgi:hypothetical protein